MNQKKANLYSYIVENDYSDFDDNDVFRDDDVESNDEGSFSNKPIWQRILVLLAGVTVNISFAIIIVEPELIEKNLEEKKAPGFNSILTP